MSNSFSGRYSQELERQMQNFYHSLSEREQRLYAAVEAEKLPQGGVGYIANLFHCTPESIRQGIEELRVTQVSERKERV